MKSAASVSALCVKPAATAAAAEAAPVPQALDAFGKASLVVNEPSGRCVWHSSLARELMQRYFSGGHFERGGLPPELLLCLHREVLRRRAGALGKSLTVWPQAQRGAPAKAPPASGLGERRLSFDLHPMDADAVGPGCWLIVMSELDDAALLHRLIHTLGLSAREAELLSWASKGKAAGDLPAVLGCSRAEVAVLLQSMLAHLGLESLAAAVTLVSEPVRG